MGGAAVAWGADEGSSYWNPALLSLLGDHRAGVAYSNLIPGIDARQSYLAYAQTLKRGHAEEPGLEFAQHAVGAIYGNLRLELSDNETYSENTIRVSYAYCPFYFVSFGASFAGLFTSSDVEDFGASGSSLEGGVRLALTRRASLGFVIRNVLSQVSFEDGVSYSLPRAYVLGLAYRPFDELVLESDIEASFGTLSRFVIGGEYGIRKVLFVRGGVAGDAVGENRVISYLGAGVRVSALDFDYAAELDSEDAFGNTQRFSLAVGF